MLRDRRHRDGGVGGHFLLGRVLGILEQTGRHDASNLAVGEDGAAGVARLDAGAVLEGDLEGGWGVEKGERGIATHLGLGGGQLGGAARAVGGPAVDVDCASGDLVGNLCKRV